MKLKKSLGQYFLIDKKALQKIVAAASLCKKDTILEIGAGSGILTKELARRANKVIAIEIDKKFISELKNNLRGFNNVEIIEGNILKIIDQISPSRKFKIVANIPYYLSSRILEIFLSADNKPELLVLLVQKEVAERVCAVPGDMSLLSISVQYYAKPEIVGIVSARSFHPRPKVNSAILKITETNDNNLKISNEKNFFKIVKIGFTSRRKTLANNLSVYIKKQKAFAIIKKAGLRQKIRAQDLTLSDWIKLSNLI